MQMLSSQAFERGQVLGWTVLLWPPRISRSEYHKVSKIKGMLNSSPNSVLPQSTPESLNLRTFDIWGQVILVNYILTLTNMPWKALTPH